jgi:hypothetical protein
MPFWSQIPYMDRDATLMGPSRDMDALNAQTRGQLAVKSDSVLPLTSGATVQLKTNVRPLTASGDSRGLDPVDLDPCVLVRSSNQNPAAEGHATRSGAIWRNSGSSSGARPWFDQCGMGTRSFLDGLNVTPSTLYTALALGIVAFLFLKKR